MKKNYTKTFIGSLAAFFLSISCCWISALALWIGGATLLTSLATYLGKIQYLLVGIGIFLSVVSLVLFFRNPKEKQNIR